MTDVYIIGSYSTAFGRWADRTHKDLTREAYLGVLDDAGQPDPRDIDFTWFGNCGMWVDGQGSIRGQVCMTPLIREGLFPPHVPIVNVEGGCATASMALHGAWKDIASGQSRLSLAVGVEKTFNPDDPGKTERLFYGGIDQYDPQEWTDYYARAGEAIGKPFAPGPDRTIFMDTYAMQAAWHMDRFGTTQRQIATIAAKNHCAAADNPKAQYRFAMTVDEVMADRPVTFPLTPIDVRAYRRWRCGGAAVLGRLPGRFACRSAAARRTDCRHHAVERALSCIRRTGIVDGRGPAGVQDGEYRPRSDRYRRGP